MTMSRKRLLSPDPSPFDVYWRKRLAKEKNQVNETRNEEATRTKDDMMKEKKQVEEEVASLKNQLQERETELKKMKEHITVLEQKLEERKSNMINLGKELTEKNLEVNEMRTSLEEKEAALATREKEHQQMREVIRKMQIEMDLLKGKGREVDAHSEQMTTEFMEALEKIRQLGEEKAQAVEEMQTAKEELSRLGIEVLAIRKEALDASLEAAEAKRKMELAMEKSEQLEQKILSHGNSLMSEEAAQEKELALSPGALLEMVTPKKKEVPKRMYCDICETFDQHETEDCPTEVAELMGMDFYENAEVAEEILPDSKTTSMHQAVSIAAGLTHVNDTVSVHGNSQGSGSLPHTPAHTGDVTTNLSELSEKLAVLSQRQRRQRDEQNTSNQTTASGPDDLQVDNLNGLKEVLHKEQWKCRSFQTWRNIKDGTTGIYYEDENGQGYLFAPPRVRLGNRPHVACLTCRAQYVISDNFNIFIRNPTLYHKHPCKPLNVSEEIKRRAAQRFRTIQPIPWPAGKVVKDLSIEDLMFAELPEDYDHYSIYMAVDCKGFNTNRLSLRKRFVLYFGISVNLQLRWKLHIHRKKFDRKSHGMVQLFTFHKNKMPNGMGKSPQEAAQAVELLLWRLTDMEGLLPDASKNGNIGAIPSSVLELADSAIAQEFAKKIFLKSLSDGPYVTSHESLR